MCFLYIISESSDADADFKLFSNTCLSIVNNIAPLKMKRSTKKSAPWFNDSIRSLRWNCRWAERKWHKDRLQVFYDILRESLSVFQKAVKSAKSKFISEFVSKNHHRQRVLFSNIDAVLNSAVDGFPDVSDLLCENILSFFVEKTTRSRPQSLVTSHALPERTRCSSIWSMFDLISLPTSKNIIDHLKPTFCPYDSIPSHFFKQIVDTIGPDLLFFFFINMCLSTGTIPDCLKHASVTPLLKKPNLDVSDLGHFRPISNLPFISKILEKVEFTQLHSFLESNSLYDTFQSVFRKLHSTKSALLKVTNDIILAIDNGSAVALVLLDLSSAFDMVDHNSYFPTRKSCRHSGHRSKLVSVLFN